MVFGKKCLPIVGAGLSLLFFSACARNFVTKREQVHLISEKTEIEIGKKAKADIIKQYGVYNDIDWQVYIDEVGQRLAKASDRPNLAYDFTIIDNDEINAFSVPGGFVFINRGLLPQLRDEAELAVVLGHEITHIAAWHGIEQLQRAGLLSTLTALGAIGGAVAGAGGAAIAIAQAAGVYENLYLLGYGRKDELEADKFGILYAARAGYDPEAALTFFARLDKIEQEEEAAQHISPYWKDHPPTLDRMKRASSWIAQVEKATNKEHPALNYNRDRFLSMVSKLPHGSPAESGVISANGLSYTNSVFGLSLQIPAGWHMDNTRPQSLLVITGPIPEVRVSLIRSMLPHPMGVKEFARQTAKEWGAGDGEIQARDVDYPAGHGLLWQTGGDYANYRSLFLVRDQAGYVLMCQMPSEQYLTYVIDCERIMRSLTIQ